MRRSNRDLDEAIPTGTVPTDSFFTDGVEDHDAFWGRAPHSNAPRVMFAVFGIVLVTAVVAVAAGVAQLITSEPSRYDTQSTVAAPQPPVEAATTTVVPRPGKVTIVDAATLSAAFADRLYTALIVPSDVGPTSTGTAGTREDDLRSGGEVSRAEQRVRAQQQLQDAVSRWASLVIPVAALHPSATVTLDGVEITTFTGDAKKVVFGEIIKLEVHTAAQVCTVPITVPGSAAGAAGVVPVPVCT